MTCIWLLIGTSFASLILNCIYLIGGFPTTRLKAAWNGDLYFMPCLLHVLLLLSNDSSNSFHCLFICLVSKNSIYNEKIMQLCAKESDGNPVRERTAFISKLNFEIENFWNRTFFTFFSSTFHVSLELSFHFLNFK